MSPGPLQPQAPSALPPSPVSRNNYLGLAFGHVGEVSRGVKQVLKMLAAVLGAGKHGARTGALSKYDAVAALKRHLQVQVAMAAWKGRAGVLLQRVGFVGRSAAQSKRRPSVPVPRSFQADCRFVDNPTTPHYSLHLGHAS